MIAARRISEQEGEGLYVVANLIVRHLKMVYGGDGLEPIRINKGNGVKVAFHSSLPLMAARNRYPSIECYNLARDMVYNRLVVEFVINLHMTPTTHLGALPVFARSYIKIHDGKLTPSHFRYFEQTVDTSTIGSIFQPLNIREEHTNE